MHRQLQHTPLQPTQNPFQPRTQGNPMTTVIPVHIIRRIYPYTIVVRQNMLCSDGDEYYTWSFGGSSIGESAYILRRRLDHTCMYPCPDELSPPCASHSPPLGVAVIMRAQDNKLCTLHRNTRFFSQMAKLVKASLIVWLMSTQVVTLRPIIDTLLASADDEDAAIALMLALRVLSLTPAQGHGRIR